jgi:hypothetical protein
VIKRLEELNGKVLGLSPVGLEVCSAQVSSTRDPNVLDNASSHRVSRVWTVRIENMKRRLHPSFD